MATATDVSICSNALLLLGQSSINDLSESSLAANLWPQVRETVLRSHPWNCAVRRRVLAPDATPPEFDWGYRFLLPEDWLRTLQVGERGREIDFQAEGRYLLADVDALYLRYIAANEDVASWDPLLVNAATYGMAAALAYPVTSSASLAQTMEGKLQQALAQARTVDGQDEPPQTLGDFPLLAARFRGLRTFPRG
ncbi:MAG: hypothetical protein ACK52V_14805 [Betaproteobacteria bacterium]